MKYKLVNENFKTDYLHNLLRARGIEDLDVYNNPPASVLQDPEDLENISQAADLYLSITNKDAPKILLIVDSDNDGFTSAAIIYQYTMRLNPNAHIDYWLHEGKQHGLQDHIQHLLDTNEIYDLLILPDSSSNDFQYHEALKDIQLPCLVLDHHLTDEKLSDNVVVVNNNLSPRYKNKELTGAGVVYQFCRYLDRRIGNQSWADDYIDLAAWGIIGDMGSMMELENRYFAREGFKTTNVKNVFLRTILEKQAYSITGNQYASVEDTIKAITPTAISFYVVPLINALIRVGTMEEKDRLFQAFIDGNKMIPSGKRGAKGTLERVAVESVRECTNAKKHQQTYVDSIMDSIAMKIQKYDLLENKVLIIRLGEEDKFPPEINGYVAMKCAAQYKKPTIVARLNEEGFIRGSARGLNDSALHDFKQFLTDSGYFEYAQGHANAFGVSIPNDNLHAFELYANEALKDIDFGENYYSVNFIRGANADDIGALIADIGSNTHLWGQNNPEPYIAVENIYVDISDISVIGKNSDTLKFSKNGVEYIKFHAKDLISTIFQFAGQVKLTIVGNPGINEYMGRRTPQIRIVDCDIDQSSVLDF